VAEVRSNHRIINETIGSHLDAVDGFEQFGKGHVSEMSEMGKPGLWDWHGMKNLRDDFIGRDRLGFGFVG
jgi:hypothetical protein